MPDFGRDLAMRGTLSTARTSEGIERVIDDLYTRLTERRGCLYFHRGYGLDVRELLQDCETDAGIARAADAVRLEVLKDERIDSASVSTRYNRADRELEIVINARCALGPFDLVLTATAAAVRLKRGS